ncbi:MAG: asparagine synthase (glutamine-hydrolyzing) [Clostridia bacterium]|nr:asparagine synthase (glutamine-hydrolyzing) [Clostridia bacterium]
MCGICGMFEKEGRAPEEPVLDRMMKAIAHRGPDGSRKVRRGSFGVGFTRLSFIDLTGGMQPLTNEDNTLHLAVNGEIFNYRELRRDLAARGHAFRSETDVEVILHLYEEYGTDFLTRLNGQFAIALYDEKERRLLLARDPMGICPLFYTLLDGTLVFASEIKAILEYPGVPRRLNLTAVDQLMNFPGIVSPVTFFKGIFALAPGQLLLARQGEVEKRTWWDLSFPEEEEDKGEAYYAERLRALLREAIDRRLIADVPVGFYVSGGLDSSVVACMIGKYLLNSAYSFSAEIGSGELDESAYQAMVRETVQSRHYAVKVAEEEIWENLSRVIYHAESAVKESYDTAAFLLSALVQSSPAKAVLTGQGSDELLCGYVGYMLDRFRLMQKGQMTPEELALNEKLWGDPYFRYERNHPEIRKVHRRLYSDALRGEMASFSDLENSPIDTDAVRGLPAQKRRSYIDCKLRLGDHLLIEHGDHMFFSHSVEGRHPFLDPEVVRFITTIPDKYKLNGTNEKYILKKAGEGIVPEPILKRRKFPFQAPGMSAMVKKSAPGMAFLDESLIKKYGIFDPGFIAQMKRDYAVEGFKLMGAYEIDYLMIALTVTMLCETFGLSV